MSEDSGDGLELGRRTFMKAAGLAVGAGAFGVGATGTAAAHEGFHREFANWRVREASKVWEPRAWRDGFRGRRDRPVGLTDSGVDALHPDLGPWNGVRVEDTAESFQLVQDTFEEIPDSAFDATVTLPGGAAASSSVTTDHVAVPKATDRMRVGATDAGLEENVRVAILDADGNELASGDGLLEDYAGTAVAVSRDQTRTVRVLVEATTSTGADVDVRVRFYENTAGTDSQTETTTTTKKMDGATQTANGTIGPSVTGPAAQNVRIPLETPADAVEVHATLTYAPQPQDLDFALEDADGNEIQSSGNPAGSGESFTAAISPETEYDLVVKGFAVLQADYEVTAEFFETVQTSTSSGPNRAREVLDSVDDAAIPPSEAKTLAWYGTPRYGEFAKARDGNGHGSHVSSIMAGSGRASTVERVQEHEPREVLSPAEVEEYEVWALAGTGVFASAYGTALSVRIEDPHGETIAHSQLFGGGPHAFDASLLDSNVATAPTTHDTDAAVADDEGRAPYTVYVTASREQNTGAPLVARLERIAVGPYEDPDATDGDQRDEGGPDTVEAGIAPNAGIVGVQGLGDGLAAFAKDPDFWTAAFGVRSVNMSWGTVGGLPFGSFGNELNGAVFGGNDVGDVKTMAEGGLLTVAAAGNSYTPANGNSAPAVADEAISVASTGPLDGLSAFSSGGVTAVDEDDGGTYAKPDVTAPGGRAPAYPASIVAASVYDDIVAAKNGIPEEDGERRGYVGKIGTSMASPYVNGVTGLVAEAMEFGGDDRPDALGLDPPTECDLEDVLRWKSILLATASETVFTAAPYHDAKTIPHPPRYDFGGRDPYEGYGRVNPDAAVDAVTRDLTDASVDGTVGLNVPEDSRAVAGYVDGTGTFTVDLSFSHLSGGNKGMAEGDPHLDLFVYDPAAPSASGDPTIVARSQALQGSTSLSFDGDGTYVVVAKLVNVPGVVNGFDVQANFDLSVALEEAFPVTSASRTDDGTVFVAGDTDEVDVAVEATEAVYLRDTVPAGWSVVGGEYDHLHDAADETKPTTVVFTDHDGGGSRSLSPTYFVEAPDGQDAAGQYQFGPLEASLDGETWVSLSGTGDTNTVVGPDPGV